MSNSVHEPNTSGYSPQYDAADSARAARSYVDEILEQDAEVASREPVSPVRKQKVRTTLMFCIPILLGLTGLNYKLRVAAVPAPSPAVSEQEARVGVYLAMQQVEAFRADNGLELPESLEDIGADAPGLEYEREGDQYRISAEVFEVTAAYTLGDDPTPFEAAATRLFEAGGLSR